MSVTADPAALPVPLAIERLPHDKHGRPIPWFVHREDDGTPDFRVIRSGGIGDTAKTTARVRITPLGKLRAVEVSW